MHFKLPQKKENPPKALTREDFLKIRDLEIPERRKSLALTRDLFLFACYTGTAYADTVSVTEENLFRDEEGSLWLKYHRKEEQDACTCEVTARGACHVGEIQRPDKTYSFTATGISSAER